MMPDAFTWAGRIRADAASALGAIRLVAGLEAGLVNGEVWVRGPKLKPPGEEAVRRVPWEERYEVIDGGLRRMERRLSDERLPSVSWVSLAAFLGARLPTPIAAGMPPVKMAIELRPATTAGEPNLLEVARQDWIAYVETAPEIRLRRLVFAVNESDSERVLVRGFPLPPLPGCQFVEAELVAKPAGFHWYPPVVAKTVRMTLGADEAELVILRTDATWSRVPRSAWIAATRSAVRLLFSPERYAG